MRIFSYILLIMTCAAIYPTYATQDVQGYICLPDKSIGFIFSNNEWVNTNFSTQNLKYLLSFKDGKWLWKEVGNTEQDDYPQSCTVKSNGFINCEFMYQKVKFNSETLRFQIYGSGSYVVNEELKNKFEGKNESSPISITIGSCSSFSLD